MLISLIHQTNYLLDRQLKSLEGTFQQKGGFRERMHSARLNTKTAEREQALSLLRELYRDISELNQPELLQKVEKIAAILKSSR